MVVCSLLTFIRINRFHSVSASSTYLNAFGDEVGRDIERGSCWKTGDLENDLKIVVAIVKSSVNRSI